MNKLSLACKAIILHHKICYLLIFSLLTVVLNSCERVPSKGWMTYRNDSHLSAIADETVRTPLSLSWIHKPVHAPKPAWYEPAEELPRAHFDNAHYVTAAGGRVFFGSMVDNKVYALSARTGKVLWTFFTEGPVRTSPTFWKNMVYVGSDDGYVYCLKARNGKLIWKYRAGPSDKKVLGNERMISMWPVRTSILIDDGTAYFGAGVFPHEGIFICALNADNGKMIWKNDTIGDRAHELMFGGISPQGYLLCSESTLYVPSGRALPAAFDRHTGEFLYYLEPGKFGGTWALLNRDKLITTSEGKAIPAKAVYEADTGKLRQDAYAWYPGIDMVISPEASYIVTEEEMIAIDWTKLSEVEKIVNENSAEINELKNMINNLQTKRYGALPDSLAIINEEINKNIQTVKSLNEENETLKSSVVKWKIPREGLCSLMLSGDGIFAGGEGRVICADTESGDEKWSEQVDGKALGLAVDDGALYVSTDAGSIYCFREGSNGRHSVIEKSLMTSPYSDDRFSRSCKIAAEEIIRNTGIIKGYCLVLGSGDGCLAYEIAKNSELTVIGIEKNKKKVREAKEKLEKAGILGTRVIVESWDMEHLPDYFANLVVSGELIKSDSLSYSPEEMCRVLKPCGGVVYLGRPTGEKELEPEFVTEWMQKAGIKNQEVVKENGVWVKATRGKLPGAGSWTQIYANPENTACSDDTLVKGSLEVLWFGAPGPKGMIDRHASAVGPLSINGRLFVQGEEIISAYDAYNGTRLWQRKIPGAVRVRAKIDGGNLVATENALYVAAFDKCYRLDAGTGETMKVYSMPPSGDGGLRRWGYISCIGNILYGSTAIPLKHHYANLWNEFVDNDTWKDRKEIPSDYQSLYDQYTARFQHPDIYAWKAFHRDGEFWKHMGSFNPGAVYNDPYNVVDARKGKMMVGDSIFALDTESGELLWQYKGNEIGHITISIGEDKFFFADNNVSDTHKRNAIAERRKFVKQGIFIESKDWKDHLGEDFSYGDIDVRTLYAIDALTGNKLWSRPVDLTGCGGDMMGSAYHRGMLFFFGTFGNHDAWRFKEGQFLWRRITALSADNGDMVWSRSLNYRVKPLIVGDRIIIEPRACDYRTGEIVMRSHPITGKEVEWEFLRPGHTCSITSASPSMLFYRSHSIGICDVEGDRGISLFGGIRPGCFTNIVPANGLVLFPEASSGCTCSFPIKCSIAFIPRERKPEWTVFITHGEMTPVRHFAINLGAPADMKDADGTVWFGYPNPKTVNAGNQFSNYGVNFDLKETIIENMGYFTEDFRGREFEGTDKTWLFTSGCVGLTGCEIPLIDSTEDGEGVYTVRLGFMAKSDDRPGQRVFDIKLQGVSILKNFDIVKEAGTIEKPVIKEFNNIKVSNVLTLELAPSKETSSMNQAPIINFIEVIREDGIKVAKTF